MKLILVVIIFFHGLIHLFGFAKAFSMADFNLKVSKTYGVLWFATTLLFIAAAATYFINIDHWWPIPALALLFSQYLIITSWKDAKFGTIANIIIFIAAVNCFANCNLKGHSTSKGIVDASSSALNLPGHNKLSSGSYCTNHVAIFK